MQDTAGRPLSEAYKYPIGSYVKVLPSAQIDIAGWHGPTWMARLVVCARWRSPPHNLAPTISSMPLNLQRHSKVAGTAGAIPPLARASTSVSNTSNLITMAKPVDKVAPLLPTKDSASTEQGASLLPTLPASSTPSDYLPVRKETLEQRLSRRLDVIDRVLTDREYTQRLDKVSVKDMAIAEGVYIDKLTQLRGQPNRVVGSDTRAKLAELGVALLQEAQRRGLSITLKERTLEVEGGPTVINARPATSPE